MNDIDLEILIPASPEFIWRFVGDISAIPHWYEEVVSVSFLSTQREGRGTRWRQSTVKGSDVIVEVSAWYDTLGYEYRLVDGKTYSENQGRIRLQEVTDGTLVRWTFQYEPGGVLGGLRNAMRLKRNATNQIQDSLRNLHQLIAQESGGISTHEAKANMRDAPDVNERSSYTPRHPSAFQDVDPGEAAADDTTLSERFPLAYDLDMALDAPMVAESDTKPNPVVLGIDDDPMPDAQPEPDLDDTRPVEVEALLAEMPPHRPEPMPEAIMPEPPPRPQPKPVSTLPEPPPPPRPEPVPEAMAPEPPPPRLEPMPVRATPEPQVDVSQLSVFEIFGLPKPSETEAAAAPGPAPIEGENRALPAVDAPLTKLDAMTETEGLDRGEAVVEPARATHSSVGATTITGWRRSARKKKTPIRSHT